MAKKRTIKRVTKKIVKKKAKKKRVSKPVSAFKRIQELSKKRKPTKKEQAEVLKLITRERTLFRPVTPKKKELKRTLDKIESRFKAVVQKGKKVYPTKIVKKRKAEIFKYQFKAGKKTITQIEDTIKNLNLQRVDLGYEWVKVTYIFRKGKKVSALTYVKNFTTIDKLRNVLLRMFRDIKNGSSSQKKYMQRVNETIDYLSEIIIDYETPT